MEKSIPIAIKGGWKNEEPNIGLGCWETFIPEWSHWKWKDDKTKSLKRIYKGDILLDPLFWQALGKAEGWKPEHYVSESGYLGSEWVIQMHNFIDYLIEGKDIDSFFEELLK